MRRKIEDSLKNWKGSKKPFMLVGARQVGKTFIMDQFCKQNFENYIYINLERDREIKEIFDETINPEEIIKLLSITRDLIIEPEKTVLFIDEIQISDKAISSLKYFCESSINYQIVCAGSLLGVALNRFESSFPVGKVYKETLYPFDFEEFLWSINQTHLTTEIESAYHSGCALPKTIHDKLLNIYREYLFVGGMPASILEYKKRELNLQLYDRNIKQNLLDSYISDMSKYATHSESIKIRKVYKSIPKQLGQDKNKFNYKLVETNSNKRSLKTSLQWLIDSMLLLESNLIETPRIPLSVYQNENIFKMFLSDVGLLCELADMSIRDLYALKNYKGMLTENFVAQSLLSNKIKLHFWRSSNTSEIDFIANIKGNIIPIEVKSATNTKSKSLGVYIEKYNPIYSIRLSCKNFGVMDNIKYIPLYAAYLIK